MIQCFKDTAEACEENILQKGENAYVQHFFLFKHCFLPLQKPNSTRVCKTGHAPLMLLCHNNCDLDLYPIEPKINWEHLLSMTNVCMKFEKAGLDQTLVIHPTRLYTTDGPTDRLTVAREYTPSSLKGA